jgi:hypothetical protein
MNPKIILRFCLGVLRVSLLSILLILPLSGCVVVRSKGSTPSKQTVHKLSDLNGEYANLSDVGKTGPRLATLVLGWDGHDENVDRIRVLAKDETTLAITLLQGEKNLSTKEVRLLEKFKKDGRSLIIYEYSGNGKEGENYGSFGFAGHIWRNGELYIANDGDVIYHETASGAGIGGISWVMIPVAGHSSKGYTFKKLK